MPDDAPETTVTGRDRLLAALKKPASRSQLTAGVLLGVLGFAGAVQVQANSQEDRYAGASQQDLIQLINSQQLATDRVRSQITDLESTRDALLDDTERSKVALEVARKQAASLGILTGSLAAVGPGVRIDIDGPPGSMRADQLVNGIQELRTAGAEAMQLNNTARLVGSSAISDGPGDSVVVDGRQLSPPYVLLVIGSPSALDQAVNIQDGFAEDIRDNSGTVKVQKLDRVEITATRKLSTPKYAEPAE